MMKFTSVYVIVVVSILVNAVHVVQGETSLRMILNNGEVAPGLSCTAEDNVLIEKVFDRPLNRRNLRSNTGDHSDLPVVHTMDESYENEEDRELQYQASAAHCSNVCGRLSMLAGGYCHKTGCHWYNGNRRLQNYGEGFLSTSALCQKTSDSINSDLDFLVQQRMVSNTCIALLQSARKIECFEDVMFGIIEQFTVIDADSDTILIPYLHARRDICGLKALNIEVLVNPCVESLNITLVNKKAGYRATVVHDTTVPGPYTLFGMNGVGDFKGQRLPLGNYTLEATPDGNDNKMRDRRFFLAQC